MTRYPEKIDSDAELPRVSDGVTEISTETLNSLREAIIAIESTIGVNPQGTTSTLVERLSVFFNEDGTAKAAALVAAGLIALPITNSMISASAAIQESKLDLDVATQVLQNQISSNDVDITSLQVAVSALLAAYANHVNGVSDKHDGYHILLDSDFQSGTPTWFLGLTANNVSQAIAAINNAFQGHISESEAHEALNISVDPTLLRHVTSSNVQGAIEQLDSARAVELIGHRDDMHSNGISLWANSTDGYNTNNQILPQTIGDTATAYVVPAYRSVIDFVSLPMSSYPIQQGDALLVFDTASAGTYYINDIGPRAAVGTKPNLTSTQLEIIGTFPSDGYVEASIFGSSSTYLLKGNLSQTIHQNESKVDSIQVSRPNAARVVSLGIRPQFIDATSTLDLEVGISSTLSRSITISDLHKDRSGTVVSPPTVDSIVERINYIFQNSVDGNAFPVAAYRVGDEIMLSHNWTADYAYISVKSTGSANFYLGFDPSGAAVEGRYVYPTLEASFYVNGNVFRDLSHILNSSGSVSGQYISVAPNNPLELGVKIGHLVHVRNHSVTAENGTYFVTDVTSSLIKVNKVAGFTTDSSVTVEVLHDALPLDDFNNNVKDLLLEVFVSSAGTLGYNERINYTDVINNLKIVDISDNFAPSSYDLNVSVSGGVATIKLDSAFDKEVQVSTSFTGKVKVPSPRQIEYVEAYVTAPVGAGTSQVVVSPHINEEEVLELCSVRLNGLVTLSDIVDKRLFGTTGLDELREDVVKEYVETPLSSLRSNGVVEGFEVLDKQYSDPTFPISTSFVGVLFRGGTALVGGSLVSVPTGSVVFPDVAGDYIIGINQLGSLRYFDASSVSLTQALDGYAGELALLGQITHNGTTTDPSSFKDLRFFVSKIDEKVELLVDETNRFVGNFASFDAAMQYVNNYPKKEKFKVRVVSYGGSITVPAVDHALTVCIDGQVNDLVINGSCKVLAETGPFRSDPHILGSVTISSDVGDVWLEGLRVANTDGYSSLTVADEGTYVFRDVWWAGTNTNGQLNVKTAFGAVATSLSFEGCQFSVGTALKMESGAICIDTLRIESCRFFGSGTGSVVGIEANSAFVSDCLFDNCGILNTLLTKNFVIRDTSFRDFTSISGGNKLIDSYGSLLVSGCSFSSIVSSDNVAISCDLSLDTDLIAKVSDCRFNDCEASVSYALISVPGDVSGCLFKDSVCPGAPGDEFVICTNFNDNVVVSSTNEFVVSATRVCRNSGLAVVRGSNLALVDGNAFLASTTVGSNIVVTSLGVKVIGNEFTTGSQDAITLQSTSEGLVVSNNSFLHSGYCINSSIAENNCVFSGNIVKTEFLILGDGASTKGFNLSGNVFDGQTSYLVSGVIGDIEFFGNEVVSGDFQVAASNVANLSVCSNRLNSVTFTGPITGLVFSDNDILGPSDLTFPSVTNGVVSGNSSSDISQLIAGGLASWTGVVVSGNRLAFSGLNAVLKDCLISNNIIVEAPGVIEWFINIDESSSANDYCRVIFSENLCAADVALYFQSAGSIRGLFIDGNIGATTSYGTDSFLNVSVSLNESVISGNQNFDISIDAGMNVVTVSDNVALNSDIILQGTINSCLISGNSVSSLSLSGVESTGLTISGNYATTSITVTQSGGTLEKMQFNTNKILGDLSFTGIFVAANISANSCDNFTFNVSGSNITISSNTIGADFYNWTSVASRQLVQVSISSNVIYGSAYFARNAGLGSEFSQCKVSGNIVNGDIYMMANVISPYGMTFSKNIVSDNRCGNLYFFPLTGVKGDITIDGLSILGNSVENSISFNTGTLASADVLLENVIISGNIANLLFLGRRLGYSDFSVVNNKFADANTSMTLSVDPAVTPGEFSKINFTGNTFNSDCFAIFRTGASTVVDSFRFDNNILMGSNFRIEYAGANLIDATLRSWNFSNNSLRAIAFLQSAGGNTSSTMAVDGLNISSNAFDGHDAVTAGVAYEPGIYFNKGSYNGAMTLSGLGVSKNYYAGSNSISPIPQLQCLVVNQGGADIVASNIVFSENRGIDIVTTANGTGDMTIQGWEILGNSFSQESARPTGVQIVSTAGTASTVSDLLVSSNSGGSIDLQVSGSVNRVLVSGNLCTGDSLGGKIEFSTTVNATKVRFAGNVVDAGMLVQSTTSFIRLGIESNVVADSIVISERLSDNLGLQKCDVSKNQVTNNIVFDGVVSPSATDGMTINSLTLLDNIVGDDIIFSNISTGGGSVYRASLSGNIIDGTLEMSAFSGTGTIQRMVLDKNDVGTAIVLPNIGAFSGVGNQSKITSNFAEQWTCATSFDTDSTNFRVFPWGNTQGSSSSNVFFQGTTASDVSTANDVGTGVVTGIQN